MSIAGRVIRNTIFLYIRMGISFLFSFFITRILLESLGASDYGIYNVVAGALSMLGFISGSLSTATQRFISYSEGEGDIHRIKKVFDNSVLLHRLIALATCLLFILAGFAFFNGILNIPADRRNVAVMVYGCMVFSTVFSITVVPYESVLNAHENMLVYSILGIIDVSLKFIIALLVSSVSSFDRLLFYAVLMALESWLYRYLIALYCKRKYREVRDIRIVKHKDISIIRQMASFAGWNILHIFTGMAGLYGLSIIVNHYFGTVTNAALGVATQFSGALLGVTSNMSKSIIPVIVKNEGEGKRNKMLDISLVGCKYAYLVFCFFSVPICFVLKPILSLWLKEVPSYTYEFGILILISELVEQTYLLLTHSIDAEGNIKGYCIWRSFFNIVSLPVIVVLFEMGLGPEVSWIVRLFTYMLIGGVITLHYARLNLGLNIVKYIKSVLIPCLATTAAIVALCLVITGYIDPAWNFILLLIVIYILSLPIVYLFGFSGQEKNFIRMKLAGMR